MKEVTKADEIKEFEILHELSCNNQITLDHENYLYREYGGDNYCICKSCNEIVYTWMQD